MPNLQEVIYAASSLREHIEDMTPEERQEGPTREDIANYNKLLTAAKTVADPRLKLMWPEAGDEASGDALVPTISFNEIRASCMLIEGNLDRGEPDTTSLD